VPKGAVAATADGARALSGWSEREPGFIDAEDAIKKVVELSKKIGHPLTPKGALDHVKDGGFPGKFDASHAEKQLAATRGSTPIAVSREMCDDCIEFFKKLAQYRKECQVVADPRWVRVFRSDGYIVEIPR
jgi:hypothetical protein